MLLVGDVGGTKTRLALFTIEGKRFVRGVTEKYDSKTTKSFEELLTKFLTNNPGQIEAACFGVPGPVTRGVAKLTNLPWHPSEEAIRSTLSIARVRLVNDLAATVASLPHLAPDQVETLHDGIPNGPDPDVFGIVAPGTGLGEASLIRNRGGAPEYIAIASEGGHGDLAPTNEEQMLLLTYLLRKFKRVSLERVLCGPGLVNIYEFLRDERRAPEPPELARRLADCPDRAAVISQSGMDEEFEITTRALDMFCELLGVEAGNMMLRVLAYGGVFLGGGIPPRIIPKLRDGSVLRGYFNKGRLTDTVRAAPLRVVTDDHAALIGAAALASHL